MFLLKKMRVLSLFIFCCSFSFISLSGQDYIHMLDGEVIEAKIKSVAGDNIQYRPFTDLESDILRVAKTDVNKVKKENGTILLYNRIPSDEPEVEEVAETEEPDAKKKKMKKPISARKLHR